MTNSKLLEFLKTIDNTELKALDDFLKVAKGAKDVNILFDYLKKYHPEYPEKNVIKGVVANKIFPNNKNNEKKLLNTMVKFVQLLDEFFIKQEFEQTKIDKDFIYIKALRRRKLDKYFFRKADQMKKQWDKESPAGLEQLHNEYRLTRMYYSHPAYKVNKESLEGFEPIAYNLDKYYFSKKLFWSLLFVNNKNVLEAKDENTQTEKLLNETIELANTTMLKAVPQIKLLSLLLKSSMSANFNDIQSLKDMFMHQIHLYDEIERSNIFTILESAYYENFNSGKGITVQNLFEMNCLKIEHNCILENGHITYNRFSNVINIGIAAKQLGWTENFIKQYVPFLPNELREDARKISNATLNFHKGAFKDALYLLADVKYKNEFLNLYGRSIRLKCCYELNDDDLFHSISSAFTLYLSRNDLFAQDISKRFLHFISFTKKLFKEKNNPNETKYGKLSEYLNNNTNIAYKSWLNEKLNELSNYN